jgi:hypothetical protein
MHTYCEEASAASISLARLSWSTRRLPPVPVYEKRAKMTEIRPRAHPAPVLG